MKKPTIEEAKDFLIKNGYAVQKIWSNENVFSDKFSEEQKAKIIELAMNDGSVSSAIRDSINRQVAGILKKAIEESPLVSLQNKRLIEFAWHGSSNLLIDKSVSFIKEGNKFFAEFSDELISFKFWFLHEKEYENDKNIIENFFKTLKAI